MLSMNRYVNAFEAPAYQLALGRLHQDLGNQDPEEWARDLYLVLRDHPMDPRAQSLNHDRKTCLSLLYQIVDEWEAYHTDTEVFEQEIVQVFRIERIEQILRVCLVMDRAQSLYKMQIPNSRFIGMHWYSKLHLASASAYAKSHGQEKVVLEEALSQTSGKSYEGSATMNKRLFRLLFTESFGLLEDPHLARWSHPQLASFVEQCATTATQIKNKEQLPTAKVPSVDCTQDESIRSTMLKFVSAYEDPEYQTRLERLHRDKGSQDPEEWARKLYLALRDDPNNAHMKGLNQDRKQCLVLLYDLVNAWQEQHHRDPGFERSIRAIFKVRRIARILSVCLVMDRAQALFKMAMPAADKSNGLVVGMHWFCELHVNNKELSPELSLLLLDYRGTGTMNKRLYWLLHSNLLGLQQDPHFAAWSLPQVAGAVYVPGYAILSKY